MKDSLATLDNPNLINGRPFYTTQEMAQHVALVICGEYALPPIQWGRTPFVLDIGANQGAFTEWVLREFDGCHVQAYEPLPASAKLFKQNHPTVELHQVAVSSTPGPVKLYHGANNLGESSLRARAGSTRGTFTEVPTLHPKDLPDCDILKVDTEGSELDILTHYQHRPTAILLEAHSYPDIRALDDLLVDYAIYRRVQNINTASVIYIERSKFNPLVLI